MKLTLNRDGDRRGWPDYLLWGRMRTSTFVLLVAFFGTWWLYNTYKPPPETAPATQVVPPGYVPDPAYTWVPRTNVRPTTPVTTTPETTTPTTTTTTTAVEPTPGEPAPLSPEETVSPVPTPTTTPIPTTTPAPAPTPTRETDPGVPPPTTTVAPVPAPQVTTPHNPE